MVLLLNLITFLLRSFPRVDLAQTSDLHQQLAVREPPPDRHHLAHFTLSASAGALDPAPPRHPDHQRHPVILPGAKDPQAADRRRAADDGRIAGDDRPGQDVPDRSRVSTDQREEDRVGIFEVVEQVTSCITAAGLRSV